VCVCVCVCACVCLCLCVCMCVCARALASLSIDSTLLCFTLLYYRINADTREAVERRAEYAETQQAQRVCSALLCFTYSSLLCFTYGVCGYATGVARVLCFTLFYLLLLTYADARQAAERREEYADMQQEQRVEEEQKARELQEEAGGSTYSKRASSATESSWTSGLSQVLNALQLLVYEAIKLSLLALLVQILTLREYVDLWVEPVVAVSAQQGLRW
jgi:hypothetical protein